MPSRSVTGANQLWCCEQKEIENKRKDYNFRRQSNEKPNIVPGCPGAERGTCGVCVTQGGVQEDIPQATAPDVHGLVGHISEDDPVGIHASVVSLLADHGLPIWREAQQPQYAVRYTLQNVTPATT